jgi:opacity protein-like surface antigen
LPSLAQDSFHRYCKNNLRSCTDFYLHILPTDCLRILITQKNIMGNPNKAGFLAVAIFLSTTSNSNAQLNLSRWQVGINAGVFVYQGDLTPETLGSYKTLKPGWGLYISRILTPSFLLRTNFAAGQLLGSDARYGSPAYRQQRNLRFTTPVKELSEMIVWNMFGNSSNEVGNRFSPYLFGGIGVNFLNIDRSSNLNKSYFVNEPNVTNGLAADIKRTPPGSILVLPVGAGVEYYLTQNISLTAETNFRYTFTDYLDGFSQVANPKKKDFYQSHTIGLVFKFNGNKGIACPVIKR